ncbi:hypothetical protein GVAV_002919 [Gurleya vavrai]
MPLDFNFSETKPCVKPYELNLNDCLACSSCISSSESSNLKKTIDINLLKTKFTILLSPHAKINIFNEITKNIELNDKIHLLNFFENKLKEFTLTKFSHKIIDTSHFYTQLFCNTLEKLKKSEKMIITSSCPGTVAYIENNATHLIDNLLQLKSQQQLASEFYKNENTVSVVTCYDKKLEKSNLKYIISTVEYFNFLNEIGFVDYFIKYCNDYKKEMKTDDFESMHKMIYIEEDYIKYFLEKLDVIKYDIKMINEDFIIFDVKTKEKNYKFAKIFGLPNFLNFIKEAKKQQKIYDFVEAFICKSSCINGPAQIKGNLEQDKIIKERFDNNRKIIDDFKNGVKNISRSFTDKKQVKKEFKIEW